MNRNGGVGSEIMDEIMDATYMIPCKKVAVSATFC